MSEMTNGLVERVEAATGPNCDIDAEIAKLQGFRVVEEGHPLGRRCYGKDHRQSAVPAYTRSLDAAMSLVPEGWFLQLEQHSTSWTATLGSHLWYDDRRITRDGDAATPALSLCAAALRARAPLPAPPAKDTIV